MAEGLTLEQLKKKGAKPLGAGLSLTQLQNQQQVSRDTQKSVGGFLGNIVESGANFVGGIANAVANPIDTVKGIGSIALGGVQKLVPGEQASEENFDALTGFLKDRYGSLDSIKETLYNDPVGFVADVASILTAGGGALGVASKVSKVAELGQAGRTLARVGQAIDPISGTLAVGGKVAQKVGKTGQTTAERLYQSSLKPGKQILEKYPDVVKTGLENGIVVGRQGLEQVADNIYAIDNEVSSLIQQSGKAGNKVSTAVVVGALDETAKFFGETVGGSKYLDELTDLKKDFIAQEGRSIPVERAQRLKQKTGTLLRKMYGELKGVEMEGKKAIVRGLKEEIAGIVPEVGELNAKEAQLIGLEKALERAIGRIDNAQLIGIKDAVVGAGGASVAGKQGWLWGLATKILDNPEVKSRIAIIIHNTSKKKGVRLGDKAKLITPIERSGEVLESRGLQKSSNQSK